MAEQRCPMCGKPNPEHLDECQHCGARLKPLIAPQPPQESGSQTPPEARKPREETSSWLESLRGGGEESAEPDWAEEDSPALESPASDLESSEENDWLTRLRGGEMEPAPESLEEAELPAEDFPPSPGEPADELELQWTLEEEPPAPEAPEVEPSLAAAPEWLDIEKKETQEPPAVSPEEGFPDWLSETKSQESPQEAGQVSPFDESPFSPDEASPEADGEAQEGVPDWLADLQGTPAQKPEEEEDELGWSLSERLSQKPREAAPPAFAETPVSQPFQDEELPDWLASETGASSAQADSGEEAIELAPGELPDWLQAMRPVEAEKAKPSPAEGGAEGTEHAGPLAGFQSLLKAETDIAKVGQASSVSFKLNITPSQQANMELLRELVESEGKHRPATREPGFSSQSALRWIISLGLLLVVVVSVRSNSRKMVFPLLPPETSAANEMVNALESAAPVLVAFDYEPGLSGELDAAAAGLLDHLMIKGARLALVSTSPLGPALGERFISQTQGEHQYQRGTQYVNLGYISGGATGLLNFALAPRQTVSLAFDDKTIFEVFSPAAAREVWASDPLKGVNSLADFALTVVITDDPDTARNWVEQVQPALRENSLLMVISAQAEPMVRPYFESSTHQVSGVVTGLAGGAAYEHFQGRANLASSYWDAFGASIMVAIFLIIAGSLYNLAEAILPQREKFLGEK